LNKTMAFALVLFLLNACAIVPSEVQVPERPFNCTAENGYEMGLEGREIKNFCENPEFVENWKLGRKVAQLRSQRREIKRQIDTINEDRSTIANISRGVAIWNGQSPTEPQDRRIAELDEKIMTIDNNAPGGPKVSPYTDYDDQISRALVARLVPNDPNTLLDKAGALTGTIIGFGLGHALQGRYSESGWKWTLGDAGTITAMAITADKDCGDEIKDPYTGLTHRNCVSNGKSPTVATVTALTWLGLRIWQSYDLWTYAGAKEKKVSSVIALPNSVVWVQEF